MKKMQHSLTRLACLAGILISMTTGQAEGRDRWTAKKANAWHAKQPWRVGCNFNPSTAINQLEMWQADSFDTKTIDRERGWAADLGLNSAHPEPRNPLRHTPRTTLRHLPSPHH